MFVQKTRNWERCYTDSRRRLLIMLKQKHPRLMIQSEARLLLNASYRGPWKALFALTKHQLLKRFAP